MLIDNPNSLNEWLINVLEPICDADPQALAKYIMALIKKDRPQDELKKICLEQLEVFLVNETNSFVNILFDTLNSKAYLNVISNINNLVEQQRSPRSHRNVPAPSGSSRRYQNHQMISNNSNKYSQQQDKYHQELSIDTSSPSNKKRRSRSKSEGRSYKRNRSRSPQQENHYTKSRRCRDYDEKGYCMRGNLCSFDHGVNPLILDSANANTVLGITAPSNSNDQNSNLLPTLTNQYTLGSLANEPYNPEAPGLSPVIDTNRLNKNFNSQLNNSNSQQYHPTVNNDNRNGLHKNNVCLYDNEFTYKRSNRPFKQNNKRNKLPTLMENQEKTTLEVRKIPTSLNTIANLNAHFSKFGTITNLKIGYDNDPEAALIQFSSNSEALSAYRSTEAILNNRFIKVFWHGSSNINQNVLFENKSKDIENGESEKFEAKKQSIRDRLDGIAEKQATITNTAVNNLINSGLINSNTPNQLASLMLSTGNVNNKLVNKISSVTSKPVFDPTLLKKQYTPMSNNSISSTSVDSAVVNSANTNTIATTSNASVTVSTSTTSPAQMGNITSSKINIMKNRLVNSVSSIKMQPQPNKEKLIKKLELQKKRQEMLSTSIQQNHLLIEKLEKAKTDTEKQAVRETLTSLSKQIKQLEDDIKRENSLIIEETNLQKQLLVS